MSGCHSVKKSPHKSNSFRRDSISKLPGVWHYLWVFKVAFLKAGPCTIWYYSSLTPELDSPINIKPDSTHHVGDLQNGKRSLKHIYTTEQDQSDIEQLQMSNYKNRELFTSSSYWSETPSSNSELPPILPSSIWWSCTEKRKRFLGMSAGKQSMRF